MAAVTERSKLGNVLWPVLAWTVAIIFFFPIFWMVFTSFKTDADAVKPEFLFRFTPTLENYTNMTQNYDYWRFAINSVITSTFATLFALVVGVPCAYAMAFNPSRGTKDILMWMLSTKMLPAAAVLYPMTFLTKNFLGIFDTHFLVILVLCLINLPIVIWMLFTYFKEIPREIIEASKMDGVTTWGEIKDILIPLAWGGVASTALLTFIFCWNEAYWTVRLTTIDAATLSKLIEGNRAPEGLFFGRLSAVSTAAVMPIVVLGWFCQKQLVQGLTFGAVK
ncbi:carbohydrate ABC transporter permease [Thalassobium sp. R2A62]|jgi:sorbitol/mannitol transport system permease protein|uniref:carbohydrate ABC transporter permease n=1 Tax=Thalassobium sp. R2A62 TaxID=633131 RepID=UPI0001B1CE5D|nr:carbohydrate ABC transporter permease [Thalassobium sp. R2A62]EET47577.1 sugar ABC transporter permease protein [Thalassobium sp. R2A62]MDG1339581.1 carbohydrate ABC transporter permease [Paracoccaceae bacterium]MDG2453956.1 carbohydrate ABC transporter permease [Paracoccaceae bacterium]